MRNFVILGPLGLLHFTALGQNGTYWTYYDLVNQAEAEFLDGNASQALHTYDKAFSLVDHPFTKDRVIAAQFALASRDTSRCLAELERAVDDGMTRAAVEQIPFLNAALVEPRFARLFAQRPGTPVGVDPVVRDSVYMHFYREQKVKEVMGRDPVLRARMQAITEDNIVAWGEHLKQGRFPGERMIGLHTEEGFADFLARYSLEPFRDALPPNIPGMVFGAPIPEDVDLCNKTALVDFLHSPCVWLTYEEQLWTAVGNGHLHPKDHCAMEEWLVRSRGNPNYLDTCPVVRKASYYNILFELTTEDPVLLAEVEQARRTHHLQSFANDRRKRRLEKEQGMVLFFGFMGWR